MARVQCKCGKILSNAMIPNDVELVVYTDIEWDTILENDTVESWKVPLPKRNVWRCPECERIYVFDGNKLVKYYVPHDISELNEG